MRNGADSELRFWKPLTNASAQSFLVIRLQPAAGDESLHGIEQLQPVGQRRLGHGLPLLEPPFAVEETPLAAHMLGIDLNFLSVVGDAFPTDLSLWHGRVLSGAEFEL